MSGYRMYRHSNRHLTLGHGVHRATHEGSLQSELFRDATLRHDLRGGEVDLSGKKQEVVVGQTAMDGRVHEIGDAETIAGLI